MTFQRSAENSLPGSVSRIRDWRIVLGICTGLIVITWFVFGQTLRFQFVNYDDPEWVSENSNITGGLSFRAVGWALTRMQAGPLASISHMLDFNLYGGNPAGHHFTNVLLHATAAILLFFTLRQMTGTIWRSAFVAALFAIHPLRVESVAWITERKDVLSGFFFMLTLMAYVWYARRPSALRYLAIIPPFLFGLLSKGILITVPIVLLLLDYWPLGRFTHASHPLAALHNQSSRHSNRWRQLVLEKIPLLIVSLLFAAFTFLTHTQGLGSVEAAPVSLRLSNAVVSCVNYVQQLFLPVRLSPFYGFVHPPLWQLVGSMALLVAVSAVVILWRNSYPYLFTGWFWYLVMLAPVSGIVQAGLQGRADRYTYLPHIGLLIIAAWGIHELSQRWPYRRQIVGVAAPAIVLILAFTSHGLTASWRDSETLWTRAIMVAPENDFAHTSLADLLLRQGRLREAILHCEAALRIRPNNAEAHNNLALALSRTGHISDAVAHWRRSLEIHPGNLNARCNLAWVLATAPDPSLRDGGQAVELVEPIASGGRHRNASVLRILGAAYAESGRYNEAIDAAKRALRLIGRQGNSGVAEGLRLALASYEANQPLRDPGLVDSPAIPPALLRRP
jgi:protein O-mannosyl-transferase